VTFARVKRGVPRAEAIEAEPPALKPFEARQITLYRSILRPQGALYEPQEQLRLAGWS